MNKTLVGPHANYDQQQIDSLKNLLNDMAAKLNHLMGQENTIETKSDWILKWVEANPVCIDCHLYCGQECVIKIKK